MFYACVCVCVLVRECVCVYLVACVTLLAEHAHTWAAERAAAWQLCTPRGLRGCSSTARWNLWLLPSALARSQSTNSGSYSLAWVLGEFGRALFNCAVSEGLMRRLPLSSCNRHTFTATQSERSHQLGLARVNVTVPLYAFAASCATCFPYKSLDSHQM